MEFVFTMGMVTVAYLLTVNRRQGRQIKNIERRIDQLFIAYGKKQAQEKEKGEGG
jgi:hypothetical protein